MIDRFFGALFEFLDKRYYIGEGIEKDLCKKVPILNWTYFFGGLSLFLFMLQIVTGVLLLIYYQPTTGEAYNSVRNISYTIPFGWLYRGLHVWGANFMIVAVFCHMSRIFFQGVYKEPRELNWVIGVCLLLATLTFSFTGYLLPWTQLSYWATTVGTEFPAAVPIVGEYTRTLIRGGEEIGQITLSRFFVLHVTVLPLAVLGLVGLHLMIVRLVGISEPISNLKTRDNSNDGK
ncbi:MAG: cytochrome bc complex cytochrome b subunit [Nitrospinota bacterium]